MRVINHFYVPQSTLYLSAIDICCGHPFTHILLEVPMMSVEVVAVLSVRLRCTACPLNSFGRPLARVINYSK